MSLCSHLQKTDENLCCWKCFIISLECSCGYLQGFPNVGLYRGRYSVSFIPKNEFPPGQYALEASGSLNFVIATAFSSYNKLHCVLVFKLLVEVKVPTKTRKMILLTVKESYDVLSLDAFTLDTIWEFWSSISVRFTKEEEVFYCLLR